MINKMKWLSVMGLVSILLCGCAEVEPFVDTRREAGQREPVGQSRPDRIAVCYNAWWDTESEVLDLAQKECDKVGKKAVFDDVSYFNCRLMSPSTAFYTCQ